ILLLVEDGVVCAAFDMNATDGDAHEEPRLVLGAIRTLWGWHPGSSTGVDALGADLCRSMELVLR
ncbi:hypothetical protein, partial [Rhizobium sp.]|uniref:hypothetical protein n=1 Tax=Rhizobium sp. TaxID=391 RepID=UPI003981CE5E